MLDSLPIFLPILWRYLLGQYIKVLGLSTLAFIAVLLTMRLDEIAHFATLGASGLNILLFTIYQIPYILPVVIPIASLISSILLLQKLCQTHELSALRAAGFGIRAILTPILIAASFLSVSNFYIVSEMATDSHLTAGVLKSELRSLNPLLLLHNKHLMHLKGIYFDTFGHSRLGETASDAIVAVPSKNRSGINLLVAKNLQATSSSFLGKGITLISTTDSRDDKFFDHLMSENIGQATTTIQDFSQMLQKKVWTLNNDHLRMPLLLARLSEIQGSLTLAEQSHQPLSEIKQIKRSLYRGYTEILRRLSIALATFTFTLMGVAFGMSISRHQSRLGLIIVIGLTFLYLIGYFSAKGIDHLLITASLLYFIPHLLIIVMSCLAINRISKGVEGKWA